MGRNLQVFDTLRVIPNAFMDSGTDPDGTDGEGAYINCGIISGSITGICSGVSMGSTDDASGFGLLKVKLTGGDTIATLRLALGLIHPLNIDKLYESDANEVILHY